MVCSRNLKTELAFYLTLKTVLNPIHMKQVLFPQVPHLQVVTSTVAVAEYKEEYGVKHKILWPFLETQNCLI